MDAREAARLEHERRRWLRPDWERWLRPDCESFVQPAHRERMRQEIAANHAVFGGSPAAQEQESVPPLTRAQEHYAEVARLELRAELATLRLDLALLRFQYGLQQKAGFRPDQPRVPAGSGRTSGQWANAGGAGESGRHTAARSGGSSNQSGKTEADEFSGSRKPGHHYVPRQVFERLQKEGLSTEALIVFEDMTTGALANPEANRNTLEHRTYNKAVGELWERFKAKNNIQLDRMTADQARAFVREVQSSSDPRIRDFNKKMILRSIFGRGRGGRGNE